MTKGKVYRAIGLMSGTSLDGVDAVFIETDGYDYAHGGSFVSVPYDAATREKIRGCLGRAERGVAQVLEAENLLTHKHIEAVREVLKNCFPMVPVRCDVEGDWRQPGPLTGADIDVIGFHGQTIHHDPARGVTVQIGDAGLLAREIGADVVADFRSADVKAGGQGAPLLPLYHRARVMAAKLPLPVAVLNIGGVANVTWIGEDGAMLAFDTGPGNALIDDWIRKQTGADFDEGGVIASGGSIDKEILNALLADSYFEKVPPKSLDRDHWNLNPVGKLSVEDGAATLSAFTAYAVKKAAEFFPAAPKQWLVAGGGRRNEFLMRYLQVVLNAPVRAVESVGWNGDALEAEGFAYLAVRSILGEPLTLPGTTGVSEPLTGGVLFRYKAP